MYFRELYDMETMNYDQYNRLLNQYDEIKFPHKTMQGVGTYRTLDNPIYMAQFAYLPPKRKLDRNTHKFFVKQETFIKAEDSAKKDQAHVPYIVVNIAFLP